MPSQRNEIRRRSGSLFRGLLLGSVAAPCLAGTPALQVPTGVHVISGQIAITRSPGLLSVTQSGEKAILTWQNFSVGSAAEVDFHQPDAAAVTLNRVVSAAPSLILGKIVSNGQLYLINANGVTFGKSAQIDVGGLVASTLALTDGDFLAGTLAFQRNGVPASIVNRGSLGAETGGMIALLGNEVNNQGSIRTARGAVVLAAGDGVTLSIPAATGSLSVAVKPATLKAQIDQGGILSAEGGQVILTAAAADTLLGGAINAGGAIEASSLTAKGGSITLAGSGPVNLAGARLEAKGATEGGQLVVSGDTLSIGTAAIDLSSSAGKAGSWQLELGTAAVTPALAAVINGALAGADVTLQTAPTSRTGTLEVNAALSWSSGRTLTLKAGQNIAINADITASGDAAGLVLAAGGEDITGKGAAITLSGGAPTLTIGGEPYTLITSAASLQRIGASAPSGGITGAYALAGDIDAASLGAFVPLGFSSASTTSGAIGITGVNATPMPFVGSFDGLGHTIRNLSIGPSSAHNLGLFSEIGLAGNVRNLGLPLGGINAADGFTGLGMLAGENLGTVANTYATGSVSGGSGSADIGGLLGYNGGTVNASYATGSVSGGLAARNIGGLIGNNRGDVSQSYATGDVRGDSGASGIGGLIGFTGLATLISDSQASGGVQGGNGATNIGGLVGTNDIDGLIKSSQAAGSVLCGDNAQEVGGLVGFNSGSVTSSRAAGAVSGGTAALNFGGLVGFNSDTGGIGDSSASGTVTGGSGTHKLGGLLGMNYQGTVTNSLASGSVSGGTASIDVGGLVGFNSQGVIDRGAASGPVLALGESLWVGGLVGHNTGTIAFSHATGSVTGANGQAAVGTAGLNIGGLVGFNDQGGTVTASYAAGSVTAGGASANIGGLIGLNLAGGTVLDSFASGAVGGGSGASDIGGLVGSNSGLVGRTYATGPVAGGSTAPTMGGLVGLNGGTVTTSYWDLATSHQATAGGGAAIGATGLTDRQAKQQVSYHGWDFVQTWAINKGTGYPTLR